MNDLTNSIATNAPVAAASGNMLLGHLDPASPVFSAIDAAIVLLVLVLLPVIMRAAIRRIAADEADESMSKTVLAMLLIVMIAGLASIAPLTLQMQYTAALAVLLIGVLILRAFLWLSITKALLLMLIIAIAGGGLGTGLMHLSDRYLPPNRVRLVAQLQKKLGILHETAGQKGTPVFDSNTLHNIKMGLKLQQQAVIGALILLRDPDSINKLTADHQSDLRALDLITDGKMPTPEQLTELNITYEQATNGAAVLNRACSERISEQDVQDLSDFLKTIRPDQSDVSAADLAVLIREARKRSTANIEKEIADAHAARPRPPAPAIATNAPDLPETLTNSLPATNTLVTIAPADPGPDVPPVHINPLTTMDPDERALWTATQDKLRITGIIETADGIVVIASKRLIRPGETVQITSNGRTFIWRLIAADGLTAEWEPVLLPLDTDQPLPLDTP